MLVKKLEHCEEFIAGDGTRLREILHPNKDDVDFRYSLAHAIVNVGDTSQAHKLTTSEIYYILDGQGEMYIDDEKKSVGVGDAIVIPPHAKQYIKNTGDVDLVFLCIVDPAWREEDEEIL